MKYIKKKKSHVGASKIASGKIIVGCKWIFQNKIIVVLDGFASRTNGRRSSADYMSAFVGRLSCNAFTSRRTSNGKLSNEASILEMCQTIEYMKTCLQQNALDSRLVFYVRTT